VYGVLVLILEEPVCTEKRLFLNIFLLNFRNSTRFGEISKIGSSRWEWADSAPQGLPHWLIKGHHRGIPAHRLPTGACRSTGRRLDPIFEISQKQVLFLNFLKNRIIFKNSLKRKHINIIVALHTRSLCLINYVVILSLLM
jgi:hypothetical protein